MNSEYISFLYDTTEKLEAGEWDCLKVVYQAFASSDMELVRKAGSAIRKALEGASV